MKNFDKKSVLLYSHRWDPVVKFLSDNKKLKEKVHFLEVSELLSENVEIHDVVEGDKVSLHWYIPDHKLIVNEKTPIINRVHFIDKNLFLNFDPEYRDYAWSEFSSYILFALSSFKKITDSPSSSHSFIGSNPPLPLLWERVNPLGISTPKFVIGSLNSIPQEWDAKSVIIHSTYDSYNWRPNLNQWSKIDSAQHHRAILAVLKPKGYPVVVSQCNEKYSSQVVDGDYVISEELNDILIEKTKKICCFYERWSSETLWFVSAPTGELMDLTLAMHNSYLYAAYQVDSFKNDLERAVQEFIS